MLKHIYIVLIIAVLTVSSILPLHADDSRVTPYGDYCAECAMYGACRDVLQQDAAVRVMDKYYRDRGYQVGNILHRGRFIEAVIYKDDRQVDRVLFDRKTGRLRSIY